MHPLPQQPRGGAADSLPTRRRRLRPRRGHRALSRTAVLADDDEFLRPTRLSNLAAGLAELYERTGDAATLDEAIECAGAAVETIPDGDDDLAYYLANLSVALLDRFELAQDAADLDAAVDAAERAIAALPEGEPEDAGLLSNLASTLTTRWQYAGDLADLDRAIELDTRAVACTDVGHPDRTTVQSNLVAALVSRFDAVDRGVEPLDEAISLARDTLAGAPPGYDVSTCLTYIGE